MNVMKMLRHFFANDIYAIELTLAMFFVRFGHKHSMAKRSSAQCTAVASPSTANKNRSINFVTE